MTPEERNDLIATYAAGYDEVMNALNGFPADILGAHPIPGKWSAREIVHHLGDSESTSAHGCSRCERCCGADSGGRA